MAYIPKIGISNTSTIDAEHITRIIDALDGTATTEVSASGQFSGSHSGSFLGDGSGLTGVTGEWDGTHNGNAQITGSLVVTANVTASGNISSSGTLIANAGTFTSLTNVSTTHVTASGNISASGDLYSGDKLYINSKEALEAANALAINQQGDFTSGVIINRGNLPQPITLNANVTASGNISSSGTLIGGGLNINGGSITNVQSITATNVAVGTILDAATGGDTNIALTGTALNIEVGGETFLETTGTTAKFSTNVTASGNISASGTISAGVGANKIHGALQLGDAIQNISDGEDYIAFSANNVVEIGDPSGAVNSTVLKVDDVNSKVVITSGTPDAFTINALNGNVTASGNISSSFTSASSGPGGVPTVSGFEIAAHRYITKTQTVAAAGNNQDTAAQISPDAAVVFTTSADNTKGVKLPFTSLVEIGTTITIHNSVANKALEIYPADGDTLLPNLSTNGPATLVASGTFMCTKSANTRWVTWICVGAT